MTIKSQLSLGSLLDISCFTWLGDFLLEAGGVGADKAAPDAPLQGDFILAQCSCLAGDLESEGREADVLQPLGGWLESSCQGVGRLVSSSQ